LLREMLDLHPEVFVFPETHWIPTMKGLFGDREVAVDSLIDVVRRTFHATGEAVTEIDSTRLRERLGRVDHLDVTRFCDQVGTLFAEDRGKPTWADKTPDYGRYMSLLHEMWPQCRFVHVIRNGLEVAVSMSRHIGFCSLAAVQELWWCPVSFDYRRSSRPVRRPIATFADLWYQRLQGIMEERRGLPAGLYKEVRFEDLMSHPAQVLDEVASFLGLPASGPWFEAAIKKVEPRKVRSRSSRRVFRQLGKQERLLLEELGYEAS
jgi:hypothetical protein